MLLNLHCIVIYPSCEWVLEMVRKIIRGIWMNSTFPRAHKAKSLLVAHMEVDFLSICRTNRKTACFLVGHTRGQVCLVLNLLYYLLFLRHNADKEVKKKATHWWKSQAVKMKVREFFLPWAVCTHFSVWKPFNRILKQDWTCSNFTFYTLWLRNLVFVC